MPYTPTNFLQAQTSSYGLPSDLIANAIEGYKASRVPAQMRTSELQQSELAKQLQHGNYKAGLENQYLPHKLENEAITSDINLKYLGREKEANLANVILGNESQKMKNDIQRKFGLSEAEADILYKKALTQKAQQDAKYAHLSHLTGTQKDALSIFDSLTSPESREYQQRALGKMPAPTDEAGEELPLPPNAIKLQGFGEGVKKGYTDKMDKNIERGEAAKLANGYLDEIDQIVDRYPHLYKSIGYIMAHPDDEGKFARAVDAARTEEEKTALDLLRKYSSSLVIAQTETSNQRATNAFRTLVSQTKPGAGMTRDAIKNVIRNMRHANDPLANYADKAAPFSGYAYIPYQAKNFQTPQQELADKIGGEPKGYKGTKFTKEEIQQAAAEEGKTEDEVIAELKALGVA